MTSFTFSCAHKSKINLVWAKVLNPVRTWQQTDFKRVCRITKRGMSHADQFVQLEVLPHRKPKPSILQLFVQRARLLVVVILMAEVIVMAVAVSVAVAATVIFMQS